MSLDEADVVVRSEHQAGSFTLEPLPDRRDFVRSRLLLGNQVVETEDHQRVSVLRGFVRLSAACIPPGRSAEIRRPDGRWPRDELLESKRGSVEQLQCARRSPGGNASRPNPVRLVARPCHPADFGHGREAIVHFREVAIGFPWVAPGPVDAESSLARRVWRATRGSGCKFARLRMLSLRMFLSARQSPPASPRRRSALRPGRKK